MSRRSEVGYAANTPTRRCSARTRQSRCTLLRRGATLTAVVRSLTSRFAKMCNSTCARPQSLRRTARWVPCGVSRPERRQVHRYRHGVRLSTLRPFEPRATIRPDQRASQISIETLFVGIRDQLSEYAPQRVARVGIERMAEDDEWRQFELLAARIERTLAPSGAVVRSPDRLRDLVTGSLREVDASIRVQVGSAGEGYGTIEGHRTEAASRSNGRRDSWVASFSRVQEDWAAFETIEDICRTRPSWSRGSSSD